MKVYVVISTDEEKVFLNELYAKKYLRYLEKTYRYAWDFSYTIEEHEVIV